MIKVDIKVKDNKYLGMKGVARNLLLGISLTLNSNVTIRVAT
jgi:hypothetical protein